MDGQGALRKYIKMRLINNTVILIETSSLLIFCALQRVFENKS